MATVNAISVLKIKKTCCLLHSFILFLYWKVFSINAVYNKRDIYKCKRSPFPVGVQCWTAGSEFEPTTLYQRIYSDKCLLLCTKTKTHKYLKNKMNLLSTDNRTLKHVTALSLLTSVFFFLCFPECLLVWMQTGLWHSDPPLKAGTWTQDSVVENQCSTNWSNQPANSELILLFLILMINLKQESLLSF